MANIAVSWMRIEPSFVEPEIMLKHTQSSGFTALMAGGEPRVKLGEGDLYVYLKYLDIRTFVQVGQTAITSLPSASILAEYYGTATYLLQTRSEFDHFDTANLGRWGVDINSAQNLARRQGTFQQLRNGFLYGFNPANGEGLINQTGATTITLPADSFGNTTARTYDPGQMGGFYLQQILNIKTRMYMLGQAARISIIGPQRVLGILDYNVVQLTSYQRPEGGSASTAQLIAGIVEAAGDNVDWGYDDTLIGQGAGGADLVILTVPEIAKPTGGGAKLSTDQFSQLAPGFTAGVIQYTDMAAPRDITTPLAGGRVDIQSDIRATSGWTPRPEAISLLSIPY
jgi:hypothetical protein